MHACMCDSSAQAPAAVPEQLDPTSAEMVGAYEAGVDDGLARNPQPNPPHAAGDPGQVAPNSDSLVRPLGLWKRALHPVPTLLGFRRYDGAVESDGAHAELAVGLLPQPQGQEAAADIPGNTFRARPQPWDSATYVTNKAR
jgi:hypothetical protein